MTDDITQPSFFKGGAQFWIGQVVSTKAQKLQIAGHNKAWGWRYKVRIFGDTSEADNIQDKDVHSALVMYGVTDGTGFGGRAKTCKITQRDIVFGVFMAPDQNFPVIMGLLAPTGGKKKLEGKYGNKGDGYTKDLRKNSQVDSRGKNDQGGKDVAKVNADEENNTGSGKGKEVNEEKIKQQLGVDPNSQEVNAKPDPNGLKKFDFTGFNQDDIKGMVQETENFANNMKDDVIKLGDKLKEEAPFDELKNTAERLTPELKNIAESFGADIAGGFEFF